MALTKDKDRESKAIGRSLNVPVAAATQIFAGAIVVSNAAGFAAPASDTASEVVLGIADEGVNNTGAAGALEVRVRKGTFEFSTAGTVVDQADVGRAVYAADDDLIEKVAGVVNNNLLGFLDSIDVETGLFWVRIREERIA